MKPCNNVEETHAQEFVDELTVLANIVCAKIINYIITCSRNKKRETLVMDYDQMPQLLEHSRFGIPTLRLIGFGSAAHKVLDSLGPDNLGYLSVN